MGTSLVQDACYYLNKLCGETGENFLREMSIKKTQHFCWGLWKEAGKCRTLSSRFEKHCWSYYPQIIKNWYRSINIFLSTPLTWPTPLDVVMYSTGTVSYLAPAQEHHHSISLKNNHIQIRTPGIQFITPELLSRPV